MARALSLRTANPTKLREAAVAEKRKTSALRIQLREAREELATTDFVGVLGGVALTAAGAVGAGALRSRWTSSNPDIELAVAAAVGVAAWQMDQPWAMEIGKGLAARRVSERAEVAFAGLWNKATASTEPESTEAPDFAAEIERLKVLEAAQTSDS